MIKVKDGLIGLSVVAIFTMGAFSAVSAADEPKAVSEPPKTSTDSKAKDAVSKDHVMMDHSKGDTKSMNMMKDKTIPIHHEGDPPAKASGPDDCKDHIMMDHSKGDTKSMNMMKDKTIPIHNKCKPTGKPAAAVKPEDHMMMDHSPGDLKSMSKMKDKKILIHHSGNDDKASSESPQT